MKRTISYLVTAALLLMPPALAQTAPPAPHPDPTAGLPPGWEEIDPRFVFLTVRLASVETSLDAVSKAMKQAGYKQTVKQDEAGRYQKGNELMDRNAGGPVRWQDFYGKTAEKFFYHPTDRNSSYHTDTLLTQQNPKDDAASGNGVPSRQGLPVHQRPPQFDYIYRANTDAQKRTEAEIAKLAGKLDALVGRQRQLETQQEALWCEISFRAVSSRDFSSKALYRFQLKVEGADGASKQKQEAVNAATAFVRSVDHAMADAESTADTDPAGAFDSLNRSVAAAWKAVEARVIVQQTLLLDMDDANTALGRFMASAKRLPNVTKNIPEANRLAHEGDRAGDDQQKQTFRAALQQSLFDCAANLYTANDCVLAMAKEWKAMPDVGNPVNIAPVVERPEAPPTLPPAVKRPDAPAHEADARVVNLLSLVDVQRDAVNGVWRMEQGALLSDASGGSRIEFPYQVPDEYDFRIVFTRTGGVKNVNQYCAARGRQFMWIIGGWNNTISAFEMIAGQEGDKNPTGKRNAKWLNNGQEYTSVVKVRKTGVEAYLDGKLISTSQTDYSDMSLRAGRTLKHNDVIGVGSNGSPTVFRTIEVTEVTGMGRP